MSDWEDLCEAQSKSRKGKVIFVVSKMLFLTPGSDKILREWLALSRIEIHREGEKEYFWDWMQDKEENQRERLETEIREKIQREGWEYEIKKGSLNRYWPHNCDRSLRQKAKMNIQRASRRTPFLLEDLDPDFKWSLGKSAQSKPRGNL